MLIVILSLLIFGCIEQVDKSDGEADLEEKEIIDEREDIQEIPGEAEETEQEEQRSSIFRRELPECTNKKFTIPPVPIDQIREITPLGNLNPPEHTLPTNHMYLHLASLGVELRAPGDIYITSMSSTGYTETGLTDYSIEFALCEDIQGYFLHVKTITPELAELLEDCNARVYGNGKYKHCWTSVDHHFVEAGTVLGTVGNEQQGNFDFGTYDYRDRKTTANPNRYSERSSASIVCPFDYYDKETQEALYAKVTREVAPKCGQVIQDVPGTLQGNWYYSEGEEWTEHLAFAHDNHDPNIAVISVGGVFTDAGKWEFSEQQTGVVNRKFIDVTADGQTYCYESEGQAGRILVKMFSDTELQIEHQHNGCSDDIAMIHPVVYSR